MGIAQTTIVFVILFMLSACTVPFSKHMEDYRNAQNCCSEINELKFEKINTADKLIFHIDNKSDYFNFRSGGSYFKAYELPKKSNYYYLKIKSYVQGSTQYDAYVFLPYIILLDEKFNVTRKIGPEIYEFKRLNYRESWGGSWGLPYSIDGEISINKNHYKEKYIILLTSDNVIGREINFKGNWNKDNIIYFGKQLGLQFYWSGPWTWHLKYSPTGKIRLTFLDDPCASYPIANIYEPYKGKRIAVLAPQGAGYHFDNLSYDDGDYFLFCKFTESGGIAIATAESYKGGTVWNNANEMLEFVTEKAVEEHTEVINELTYKITDQTVGAVVNCNRIEFSGKYSHTSPSLIYGYDILCLHPEWKPNIYPYVVRIGATYQPAWEQTNQLPNELELFHQNVTFPGQ